MANKKLIGMTMALMSLAMLGGCSKPVASSSASDTGSVCPVDVDLTTSPVCEQIDSTKVPTTFVEGKSYNLDDYVTMTPADTKWNVVAKSANLKVCGHTLTCTDVGDYEFQIIAGSNNKKRAPEGKIISADVQAIRDFISGASYNYSSQLVKFGETYDKDEVALDIVHDDKYFFYTYMDSDTKAEKTSGLILLSDNNIYEATIVDGKVVPAPGVKNSISSWHYYYGAMALPLISTQIVDEVGTNGATGNVVILPTAFDTYDANNMTDIAYCCGLMDTFDGTDNGTDAISSNNNVYNTSKVVLELRDENGTEVLTIRTYKKDGTATGYGYKVFNIGSSLIQAAKDYATSGAIPAPAYITELSTKFKEAKTAKNYEISGTSEWRQKTGDALTTEQRTTLGDPKTWSSGKSLFETNPEYNAIADVTSDLYVAQNKKVVDSADATKFQKTVVQKKQSDATDTNYYKLVEDVTTDTTTSKTTVADTYKATKITDFTDLWLSNDFSAAVITDAILDAARYSSKDAIAATETEPAYTKFQIDNATDSGALAFAIDRLFPLAARPLYNNNLDKNGKFQEDSYKYITTTVLLYTDKIVIEQYEGVNFGDSTTPVVFRYYENMTISSIGTATATAIADANVTYPVA